jgi:diguanylate cyclase (GGDEF)-like protein
MNTPKFDLKRYLTPSDAIYVVVIVIGLFILVFLGELPVRLIGACMALLSGVVLVININQRLKDRLDIRRPTTVSQPVELSMKVKKDATGTRYVFDDFQDSFGGDDEDGSVITARQQSERSSTPQTKTKERTAPPVTNQKSNSSSSVRRIRIDEEDGSVEDINDLEPRLQRRESNKASSAQNQQSSSNRTQSFGDVNTELDFSDEISGVRIIGKKTAPETNVSTVSKIAPHDSGSERQSSSSEQKPNQTSTPEQQNPRQGGQQSKKNKKNKRQIVVSERLAVVDDSPLNDDLAPETAVLPMQMVEQEKSEIAQQETELQEEVSHRSKQLNVTLHDFFDDEVQPSSDEPRKEFDHLLSRVLMVIRSMMSARTTSFFWVNTDKAELVLESHITDVPEFFTTQRKHPLALDIISQIANSGRPEILTEIKSQAELDIIPYYTGNADTRSFVGVPVYLNQTVIGILCADSTQDDAYDEITIGSLGHFTKLIGGLIQSYTGKYDLLQSSRTLDALSDFRSMIATNSGLNDIAQALVQASQHILDYQTIGVVMYDQEREIWTLSAMHSKEEVNMLLEGDQIETNNSLIAQTLYSGTTVSAGLANLSQRRYHPHEMMMDNGYFVAVPLRSPSHNYGALFVEGHTSQFTTKDVSILETLGEQTGVIIEQLHVQEMLTHNALTDASSGLLNGAAFVKRVDEELLRSHDYRSSFSMTLIAIDRYQSVESQLGEDEKEEVLIHVASIVNKHIRPYDVIGRLDTNLIGLGTSGKDDRDMQLVAEIIRKEIAISVKEISGRKFTVTVSIGIANSVSGDNAETLITNANQVLEKAMTKGNSIAVFG